MTSLQDRARRLGIDTGYTREDGVEQTVSEETLRAILEAMGHDPYEADAPRGRPADPIGGARSPACFTPGWFKRGRCWGFNCQLYGLRSARNWGIGDFGDLAVLARVAAEMGADFVGVNPLHALFSQSPEAASPYSPSSRRFLNPLYIAPDLLPEAAEDDAGAGGTTRERLREAQLVDYPAVARAKRAALERAFAMAPDDTTRWAEFEAYRRRQGGTLQRFALHEAISEEVARKNGAPLSWPHWPAELRSAGGRDVREFADTYAERVTFHAWQQWLAAGQLVQAQTQARQAGMRIGIYADLAVGVAGDGAATWAEPDIVVPQAHIGAPPDLFNLSGQDWGLAPFSPEALLHTDMAAWREDLRAAMETAGAMRLDHAMVLSRLFWIPEGHSAAEGAYVRYPFEEMMRTLAEESQQTRCVVVGEALGTVEPDFRRRLAAADVLSYEVLFFERRKDGAFKKPRARARKAMACVSTHDLATLAGWWSARDVDWREVSGFVTDEAARAQRTDRARDRERLLDALRESGDWPDLAPQEMSPELSRAVHAFAARTPARMFSVQLEDALGLEEQANLPGPGVAHPNWRRKLPVLVERLAMHPGVRIVTEAVVRAREGDGAAR